MSSSSSLPDIVFGAGGIGDTGEGWFTYTWTTPEQVSDLLKTLTEDNIKILDSAAGYPPGNAGDTNRLLGASHAGDKGFIIDTKVSPLKRGTGDSALTQHNIEASVAKDLAALGVDKVRCIYAHAPDTATPVEETAAAFDAQYQRGRCEMIGLSNYSLAQLQEYVEVCEKYGYVKPSIYQFCYNSLYRFGEADLIPFCRKHGLKLYAYSPLAGGFLTGKVTKAREAENAARESDPNALAALERTRYAKGSNMQTYVNLFDHAEVHDEMRKFMNLCAAQTPPVEPGDANLRWIYYHSRLRAGDGIIIGASKVHQLQGNVDAFRQGPLSDELKDALDKMWLGSRAIIDPDDNFGGKKGGK